MSGVNRNVLADINDEPVSQGEYEKAFSPDALRAEKGTDEEAKSE